MSNPFTLALLAQQPPQVGIGGVMVAKVAASAPAGETLVNGRAPTAATDELGVTVPGFYTTIITPAVTPESLQLSTPVAHVIPVAAWDPQVVQVTVDEETVLDLAYPAIGDACLIVFDDAAQLWVTGWSSGYTFPPTSMAGAVSILARDT